MLRSFPLGLMLGRILLLWLNKKVRPSALTVNTKFIHLWQIGERLALFIYALIAIMYAAIFRPPMLRSDTG